MPELVSTEPTHPALVPSSLLRRAVALLCACISRFPSAFSSDSIILLMMISSMITTTGAHWLLPPLSHSPLSFAAVAVAVAAVAVALGASPPLPATCPALTTSTRSSTRWSPSASRPATPKREASPTYTYLLKRLKQLERENAAQAARAEERRAAPEEAHPFRGRRRQSERAGHRAQAQVVRSRLPRTVSRGARAPERADRGRIGPRRLRHGSEHCRGQGARPIPRARRVTTKHGPDALQPHGAPGRSWLAWAADAARDQHSLVAAVSTKSWPA